MDYSDEYGGGFNEEDLSGLTIQDSPDGNSGDMDAADLWLAQMENSASASGDGASFQEELIGSATAETLQLTRIGHVEPRIQAGLKAILSGENVAGITPMDAAAAREQFASEIGGDTKAFARQIRLDESVNLPNHPQDLKTVVSMLQNTSGEYMTRGPGKQLAGNIFDAEKQSKADADLQQAFGYIKELAGLYIDGRTIGSRAESSRRLAVEEALTSRFLDSTLYDGSKNILPLPNETGVTGIVPTQGIYRTAQGTAEDRLSAGQFDDMYKTYGSGVKTKYMRDESGYKVFKDTVSLSQKNDILRRTPSLQNSLFPKPQARGKQAFSYEETLKQGRDQKYAMEQAQYKADFARRVLRQQLPTNRDETAGQIRMSGFDTPYGEQADLQNLRNEAAIQDITWHDKFAGQTEDGNQSTLTEFMEKEQKPLGVQSQWQVGTRTLTPDVGEYKQGGASWKAMRKGKITASTAAGLLSETGVETRAMELAMERLGTGEQFHGNAHTREGNEGEEKALRSFMSNQGRGLTVGHAAFIEDSEHEGFGISPDGMLRNEDGTSAGLLELKYLSSGSMAGAVKKYTPQMQLQMAISGESQTNFYALDKYTGEYVHEVVQADAGMQQQLLRAGKQALDMSAELDNRGVQALSKRLRASMMPRKKAGASEKVTGQSESFAEQVEAETPMTAFDAGAAAVQGIYPSGAGTASATKLGQRLEQADQRERMKEATDAAMPENVVGATNTEKQKDQAKARNAFVESQSRPAFGDATDNISNEMSDYYKQAQKEAANATKEASESLRNFTQAARDSVEVMAELGGVVMGGNVSGMNEVRLAAETGQDVARVRGTREALEVGGLDTGGANRVIMQSSTMAKTFNDEAKAAGLYTDILEQRGRSNLPSVRNINVPSIQQLQGMSPQEITTMVAGMMEGQTPQAKAQIGQMFGMSELATYDQDPSDLMSVDSMIDGEGLRATHRGATVVSQADREAREFAGSLGEAAGFAAAGAGVLAGVVGSKTMGKLAKASPSQKIMSQAQRAGGKAAGLAKNLSNAAKASPMAIAASVAPMAIRGLGNIKDDGGIMDSAMDVAEFAAYGAAAGSVVPVVGTAAGALAGGAVGLANEAWEYFSADDAMPDTNIGAMPQQGKQATQTGNQTVNVEVTNEISPDLIRTTTDVNGDLSVDEESGLGTGG